MNKQYLLDQAAALPKISEAAAAEYSEMQPMLAEEVSRCLLDRKDIDQLIGAGNRSMMEDNHRNHGRFIASLLGSFDAGVLVETILWVFRAYRSHGFQVSYWNAQLDAWLAAMGRHLSPETATELKPLYSYMLLNHKNFANLSDQDTPHTPLISGATNE